MTPEEHADHARRLLCDAAEEVADVNGSGGLTSNIIDVYRHVGYLTAAAQVHALLALRPGPARPAEATVTALPEVTATPVGAVLLIDRDGELWVQRPDGVMVSLLRDGEDPSWIEDGRPRESIEAANGPLMPVSRPGALW